MTKRGDIVLNRVTAEQRRRLRHARDCDDLLAYRMDLLVSERAQAFRDCIDAGIGPAQLARWLGKNRTVIYRALNGPLPIERWKPDTEEGQTA